MPYDGYGNWYGSDPEPDPDDYEYGEDSEDVRAEEQEERYDFAGDISTPPALLLPEIEGRKSRLISWEQEVGAGRNDIAAAMYEAGFSSHSAPVEYHYSSDSFVSVERDSTVNGEVIYSKLALADPAMALKAEEALGIVRDAIKSGVSKLDMRCGFHIHVDAKGYGMNQVENLYHLWNYLEDTIYRLAAANWSTHRTLVAYDDYAPAVRKGLQGKAQIGSGLSSGRNGLNFSNFLNARSYCRCGAFEFAAWEDCRCNLPKCTIEFRVFNATANLRKIHAYSALSLAMVEFANKRLARSFDRPFSWTRMAELPKQHKERSKRNLDVIFNRLPLTDKERENILYCVENSSLKELVLN